MKRALVQKFGTPPAPGGSLNVRGLRKAFGGHLAVEDISLTVQAGTCLGLLGPNGAGKSTTLAMLAGVLRPDAGSIDYANELDPARTRVRRRIGFVPQSLAVYPDLTAEENLRLFARLHAVPRPHLAERVHRALELAGLRDQRDRRVRTFSGGMQRRLNLACATLHDPVFLLLDEPTVGVDPQSREHLFLSIERLKAAGLTIVYSTHYMEEAERLCDRVAIVDRGRLIAEGTTEELLRRHGGTLRVEATYFGRSELRLASGARAPSFDDADVREVQFECDDASEVLPRLVLEGDNLRALTVRRPSLETVFLALTGRSLRD